MKNCPNCSAEVEPDFQICWNCNYSFTKNCVINIKDENDGSREIDCLRCKIPMAYSGVYKFHEGAKTGALGNLFELFLNRESFELYLCAKCGKVEMFTPLHNPQNNQV